MTPQCSLSVVRCLVQASPSTLASAAPGRAVAYLAQRHPAAAQTPISAQTPLAHALMRGAWRASRPHWAPMLPMAAVATGHAVRLPAVRLLPALLVPSLTLWGLAAFVGGEALLGASRYELLAATARGQGGRQLAWIAVLVAATLVVEIAGLRLPWHLAWGLCDAGLAIVGAAVGLGIALALRWHALGAGMPPVPVRAN